MRAWGALVLTAAFIAVAGATPKSRFLRRLASLDASDKAKPAALVAANKKLAELDASTKSMLLELDRKAAASSKAKAGKKSPGILANSRFVATHASLEKARDVDPKAPLPDPFGYGQHRFKRLEQLAQAETKAKAKTTAGAQAGASMPPSGIVPSSPYEYMSPSGRGFQDVNTPFYGHYAGVWGPMGALPPHGYGSFPNTIDPRGFGSHSSFPNPWSMNYSTPWTSYLHGIWPTPPKGFATYIGSGAEGFKYQVPWAQFSPSAPFSGNPFQQTSPLGPYKQTVFGLKADQQSAMMNYTQFGPSPFGPYGVNNRYSRQWGAIPGGVVPYGGPGGMAINSGMGPVPFHHSGFIPASFPGGGALHHALPSYGGHPHVGMVGFGGFGWAGLPRGASYPGFPGSGVGGIGGSPHGLGGYSNGGPFGPFPFGPLGPAASPGNMYQGAMPFANNAFAHALPGIPYKYSPNLGAHHASTLPGNRGQFKDPGYLHNFGQGYPTPDFDRYSSVVEAPAAPTSGAEAAKFL